MTVVGTPSLVRRYAAVNPAGPAPITKTSLFMECRRLSIGCAHRRRSPGARTDRHHDGHVLTSACPAGRAACEGNQGLAGPPPAKPAGTIEPASLFERIGQLGGKTGRER